MTGIATTNHSLARGPWSEARRLLWTHRAQLATALILILIGRLAGLVLPASSKWLMDAVISENRWDLLPRLAAAVAIATIIECGSSLLVARVVGVAAQRAINEMRKTIQAHVTRLPLEYFDSMGTGSLLSKIMTDPEGLRHLIGTSLVQLASSVVTATVALSILLCLNWRLTLLMLLIFAGFGGGTAIGFMRLRPVFRARGEINAEVTGHLAESLSGIRIVKAYAAEKREEVMFVKGAHRLFRTLANSVTGVAAVTAFGTVVLGFIGIAMILVGGASIRAGTMTVGDFLMYLMFIGMVSAPVGQFASGSSQISEALASLDRIRDVRVEAAEENEEGAGHQRLAEIRGDVVFDDVSFEYTPGVPVLRQISFCAAAGSTIAVVGPSGSGKTTLISLIMGFIRPKSGRVLVDGCDLAAVRLRDYRRHLGVVLQDTFLFAGTIADNIAYGKPQASHEEIRAAARAAYCDEFIEALEHGYDTIVGERGVRLSGGQRQRVAIARAILANPRILVLDEATSSLDRESEALIQVGLKALRHQRTTFVVAHRLLTIRSADLILVLDNGRVLERGTHGQLFDRGGMYWELYNMLQEHEGELFINPGEVTCQASRASQQFSR